MTELSAEKLAELREIAGKATPGPWEASGGEIDQHWSLPEPWDPIVSKNVSCGAYCMGGHSEGVVNARDEEFIAAFDPPTVIALLDRIAEQQAELAQVEAFINERPGYITELKNTRASEGLDDYYRWAGHAEARRQLAQELGLAVPYEPGETTKRIEGQDD